jgi:hypothetical protein
MDKINLEKIIRSHFNAARNDSIADLMKQSTPNDIIDIIKEACSQVLERAAENADYGVCQNDDGQEPWIHESNIFIDKRTILNTINEIE